MGRPQVWDDRDHPGHVKLRFHQCHQLPYCITCVGIEHRRRIASALNTFNRCTPAGKQPRFIHAVQTAPLTEDGQGWGQQASQDHREFARIVWRTTQEHLGEGAGGWLSYQDFGERAFAKRHPHIDYTINGWMLNPEGKTLPTPAIDMRGHGMQCWNETLTRWAGKLDVGARRGHIRFRSVITGRAEYYRVMVYQLRELVDLRKLDYSRERQLVWWRSYRSPSRQQMTVSEFLEGMLEYQRRLGVFGSKDQKRLHVGYGHMARKRILQTQRAMGGQEAPHGKSCPCNECGTWDILDMQDIEREVGHGWLRVD